MGALGGSPTVQAGLGDPIMVRNNGKERLLVDGGGLCSPGFWRPWRRPPSSPLAVKVREQLMLAMFEEGPDASKVIKAISTGDGEDPFGEKVTLAARCGLEGLVAQGLKDWEAMGPVLQPNIQVRLLPKLVKFASVFYAHAKDVRAAQGGKRSRKRAGGPVDKLRADPW